MDIHICFCFEQSFVTIVFIEVCDNMFMIDLFRHLKNGNHLSMEMIYYGGVSRLHKTISYRIQTVCRPRRNTIGAYL